MTTTAAASAAPLIKHWVRCAANSVGGSAQNVGIVELSSPANRNALSTPMLHQLHDAIHRMQSDPSVRVVIVQSQKDTPAFSSGHDLREIRAYQRQSQPDKVRTLFHLCSAVMSSIVTSPLPFIAKVDGVATAAGCQLVASCDLAYATERSRFATPGVDIGLFCSTPGVALGRSVSRKHAMEMLLTGSMITAQRAADMGLINSTVPNEGGELDRTVDEVADIIASKSPLAIRVGKPTFMRQMERPDLEEAYGVASEVMIDNVMEDECGEGVDAFLGKRVPEWGKRVSREKK